MARQVAIKFLGPRSSVWKPLIPQPATIHPLYVGYQSRPVVAPIATSSPKADAKSDAKADVNSTRLEYERMMDLPRQYQYATLSQQEIEAINQGGLY
jgi:hypothetical protein